MKQRKFTGKGIPLCLNCNHKLYDRDFPLAIHFICLNPKCNRNGSIQMIKYKGDKH